MNSFWEKNKIPISIIIGALIIGFFIYFTNQQKTASVSVDIMSASPTPLPTVAKPSVLPSPTSLPSPTPDETTAIKAAMSKKIGVSEGNLEVTVSQNTGQFAKGTVKEKTEAGGAYFLAAKTATGWVIVYDGQSQPPCQDLETYKFPKDLAPECLSASGKVVTR